MSVIATTITVWWYSPPEQNKFRFLNQEYPCIVFASGKIYQIVWHLPCQHNISGIFVTRDAQPHLTRLRMAIYTLMEDYSKLGSSLKPYICMHFKRIIIEIGPWVLMYYESSTFKEWLGTEIYWALTKINDGPVEQYIWESLGHKEDGYSLGSKNLTEHYTSNTHFPWYKISIFKYSSRLMYIHYNHRLILLQNSHQSTEDIN